MFSIGDRVQVTGNIDELDTYDDYIGQTGTITHIDPTEPDLDGNVDPYPILVEFDEPVDIGWTDQFFAVTELTPIESD